MTSDLTVPLRDQLAAVARTVPLRLGPNALRLANDGERICLSGSEAEELADELLPVVEAYVAGRVVAALADVWDEAQTAFCNDMYAHASHSECADPGECPTTPNPYRARAAAARRCVVTAADSGAPRIDTDEVRAEFKDAYYAYPAYAHEVVPALCDEIDRLRARLAAVLALCSEYAELYEIPSLEREARNLAAAAGDDQ